MSERGSCYRVILFIWICKIFDIKVIIQSHGGEFEDFYNKSSKLFKRVFKASVNKADCIVTLTEGHKKYWERVIAPKTRIEVIPNSVTIPIRTNKHCKHDSFKILYLGAYREYKGLVELLDAIFQVNRQGYPIELSLHGDGEVEWVRQLISDRQLSECVKVGDWLASKEKEAALLECDILILPSKGESFGIVLLEAMSYEVPVICTDGGYAQEIVSDKVDGKIAASGSAESIAQQIVWFLRHNKNIADMGIAGRNKVILYYSRNIVMEKIKTLYKTVYDGN